METRKYWMNELRAYLQPPPPIVITVVFGVLAIICTVMSIVSIAEGGMVGLLFDAVIALCIKFFWYCYQAKVRGLEQAIKDAAEVTSEDTLAADFAASYVVERDVRLGKQYIYMASDLNPVNVTGIIHASEILYTEVKVDRGAEITTTELLICWTRKDQKRIDSFHVGKSGASDRYTRTAKLIEEWASDWRKENDPPEL